MTRFIAIALVLVSSAATPPPGPRPSATSTPNSEGPAVSSGSRPSRKPRPPTAWGGSVTTRAARSTGIRAPARTRFMASSGSAGRS